MISHQYAPVNSVRKMAMSAEIRSWHLALAFTMDRY